VSPEWPPSRLVLTMMRSHYKQKLQIAEQKNEEYVGNLLDINCLLTYFSGYLHCLEHADWNQDNRLTFFWLLLNWAILFGLAKLLRWGLV
jgi:hypothetical protein